MLRFTAVLLSTLILTQANGGAQAEPLAKNLFGGKDLPAAIPAKVHGFYSKGCIGGAVAIAKDGPNWQAMRPSRNRRWGHPTLINTIEDLSVKAKQAGWNGLMVGDISQPRGGPMLTGHASHQIGLDADIWLMPMPDRRLTVQEREDTSAISVLKGDSLYVDDRKWSNAHTELLRNAARYPHIQRLLVHPGIKKKLCDTVKGDRTWLSKVRPFWGHHYHFHMRMACPANSPGCKRQAAPAAGDGCDKSLAWLFTDEPWKKPVLKKGEKPPKPKPRARDIMTMKSLPNACSDVLQAPNPVSLAAVVSDTQTTQNQQPAIASTVTGFAPLPDQGILVPNRPFNPQ